jgi:hypothetical protein
MTPPCDDGIEMRHDHELDDRSTEEVLRGRAAALGDEHRALGEVVAALRGRSTVVPVPSPQLAWLFVEGMPELPASSVTQQRTADSWLGRGRIVMRRNLMRVAGLGLVAKLALVGTAAAAAVGGAGVAGILPSQVDRTAPPVEASGGLETAEAAFAGEVDGQEAGNEASENSALAGTNGAQGHAVADRARIAQGDDQSTRATEAAEAGLATARDAVADTPAKDHARIPLTVPPSREPVTQGSEQQDAGEAGSSNAPVDTPVADVAGDVADAASDVSSNVYRPGVGRPEDPPADERP